MITQGLAASFNGRADSMYAVIPPETSLARPRTGVRSSLRPAVALVPQSSIFCSRETTVSRNGYTRLAVQRCVLETRISRQLPRADLLGQGFVDHTHVGMSSARGVAMTNLIDRILQENDDVNNAKPLVDVEGMSGPRLCNLRNRLVAYMPADQTYFPHG